ncbi:hypothetical protein [uncultured Williamsia sp.]|uniref:hypothetical protein n=1 Tax=uncultured Williamsia sp. TaxID=259311 RepID=UPI00261B4562|nr:hypothetical protein [uncultured Williamsia sp.]
MVSGWFRRDARTAGPSDGPVETARAEMVRAFLDLDRRLSVIDDGVDAARDLGLHPDMVTAFGPLRDEVYATIDDYLRLSADPDPTAPGPAPTVADLQRCTAALHDRATRLDTFYERHATSVEHARSAAAALPTRATQAIQAADQALAGVGGLPPAAQAYASVRAAVRDTEAARDAVGQARTQGRPGDVARATERLVATTEALRRAIERAPGRTAEVTRALASVRTRRSAVATRAERLPDAYSALLREFSAACSEDVVGDDRRGREAVDRADEHIRAAAGAADSDPEAAAREIAAARDDLARAEGLVDGVTDRLDLLRSVRDDPGAVERRTRFAIRDAQLLAVDRGLVARWGSVIDAAARRVDRAAEGLTGRHPDYLAYVRELDSVSEFVADVVGKMKSGAR